MILVNTRNSAMICKEIIEMHRFAYTTCFLISSPGMMQGAFNAYQLVYIMRLREAYSATVWCTGVIGQCDRVA